ncbi:MAG TPA: helix-turn-helix domain-containing protein [Edaphobacter sp.]|jgi:hypothetical protein|nr:helix-turn-helix domain-containing protein [Edaphobacter sp.]
MKIDDYITDTLLRDIVGHDRRPTAFLVYLWLAAEHSRTRKPIQISYQDLAENIGISKSAAQSAINWLLRRKLLTVTRQTATATPIYTVQKTWK